ncbi:G-type lectin S-receptor-like serine/threonine-protein kinase LECRK3 [Cryptomeria japonica]|uniref:G-type lectin S-receptor-like serine/threonine-protein kinase LECRK3 n=1 Tax=Cryptomeria japonica TaxID=3369 RepID=UPI0027DA1D85|nr:G-type lectin S-receptor-like serine/threonine-protein kinase LECRK3 [Cryptomeria japonica]
MAAPTILTLIAVIMMFICVSAQKPNITLGSNLSPPQNSKWVSPNGQFAFGFYELTPTQYVLGVWFDKIPNKTLVWTVMKDQMDIPVEKMSTLQLTNNGLSLYDARKSLKWSAAPQGKIAAAAMLDNGNFVLLNASFEPIWQSFDHPTDTLLPGQVLKWKSTMYSKASSTNFSSGRFELALQEDAYLVLYPVDRVGESQGAYWATAGFNQEVNLNFDSSGLLYLVNTTNITVYNVTAGGLGKRGLLRRMTLESDGILAQYVWNTSNASSSWSSVWQAVNDSCKQVKGQCGRNGICHLNSENKPDCSCPPQFSYIDSQDHFKGCVRSSSPGQRCSASSTMSTLDNTDWGGGKDYSVLQDLTENQCLEACRNDCFCVVVTHSGSVCRKKRMPLLDGRQGDDITSVAFVKGSEDVNTPSPFSPPLSEQRRVREKKSLVAIGISLLACSSALIVAAFLVCLCGSKLHKIRNVKVQPIVVEGLKAFCYKEIETATGGFREELGRGAFGKVYKGSLQDGRAIAVKALADKSVQEQHGEREFRTEMTAIGSSYHKNLVQLYGFCDEGTHRLLVYEYMSHGSLDTVLFGDSGFLDWRVRGQIAMGTARGLLYLHEECRTQILHCDIKPQNILLDQNYNPKISDFGLAKLLRAEQTRTITGTRGTKGYIAPEWINKLPISAKVDVYSFGVMLLEIICCRKTMDFNAPEKEIFLSEWVYECLKRGELAKLVEQQQVEGEGTRIESRQLERMVLVGLWCIQEDPALRPSMKKVVQMMDGTVEIAVPPPPGSFVGSLCL